jgi:tRNA nucleotidyltransferase (CCA-adding enzyme)
MAGRWQLVNDAGCFVEIILTHNNADFDAVASLLGAHKLHPVAVPVLPPRLDRNVEEFVTLYQNGLPFVRWEDFRAGSIERVILVDTQRVLDVKNLKPETPIYIIDHHPKSSDLGPHVTFTGDEIGSTAALLVEQIRQQMISLTSLEATLLALGIYSDTGSLTYGTTTPRDIQAAAWLLEQNALLDTVRRFLAPPLTDEQETLFDMLLAAAESRSVQGYTVVVCAATFDSYVSEVNTIAHRLRDVLDPVALFVIAEMPRTMQLVCRATGDFLDVGEIARLFGGGGHPRAAAAKIEGKTLDEAVAELWDCLEDHIRPMTRVADLMSYGVQTVQADQKIVEVIQQLRRIGHEGYPVMEDGRVVGLLTRRDADRALEHGLKDLRIRDIMTSGEITLKPDDTVSRLEQVMVESDWGQIPVIDDDGVLLGIVTRTDLIKYWARVHPAAEAPQDQIEPQLISDVLGAPVAALVDAVVSHTRQQNINLYLVGGVVRDLLLHRPNYDIDFVVEDDAIHLARELQAVFGGHISSYRPFGTAKWKLNDAVIAALGIDPADARKLPGTVDFATSRNEFYEHPTALPSVYNGSIKLDLHRRDFTINTLAIQLSPELAANRLLDFYGGLSDLRSGMIRVLHSLSFVDDPTRILRAMRFEHRLGFMIERRSAELIETALPMLRRVTGERLRNELSLLLREENPERALLAMQERGVLSAIHPAFSFSQKTAQDFNRARRSGQPWPVEGDLIDLYWHLLMARIPVEHVTELAERLLFGQNLAVSYEAAAALVQQPGILADPAAKVSQVVVRLDGLPGMALLAALVAVEDSWRKRIADYIMTWRHVHPTTNGHTLKAMGLNPGPCYKEILSRLRAARLDEEITDDDEERQLLDQLVEELGGDCA